MNLSPYVTQKNSYPPRYSNLSNLPGESNSNISHRKKDYSRGIILAPVIIPPRRENIPGIILAPDQTFYREPIRTEIRGEQLGRNINNFQRIPFPMEVATTQTIVSPRPFISDVGSSSTYPWYSLRRFGWIIGIVVLVLVILAIWFFTRTDPNDIDITVPITPEEPVLPDPLNDPIGASSDGCVSMNNGSFFKDPPACVSGPTRAWNHNNDQVQGDCTCQKPFFGEKCYRESYSDTYTSIGNPDIDDLIFNKLAKLNVDRISFPFDGPEEDDEATQKFCTQMCDIDKSCVGVLYEQASIPKFGIDSSICSGKKPKCTLIGCSVTLKSGGTIPFDVNKDATLYLKTIGLDQEFPTLKIKDRVFVWKNDLPLRYWLTDRFTSRNGFNRMIAMFEKRLYTFDFVPTNLINQTGTIDHRGVRSLFNGSKYSRKRKIVRSWTGIFSDKEFETNNNALKKIICTGNTDHIVIVQPGQTELIFPDSWGSLFGLFVDRSTL